MRELTKDEREQAIEYIAGIYCWRFGIAPIEAYDGGANWFLFAGKAAEVLDKIEADIRKIEGKDERRETGPGSTATD
jgi:hypothetical protein